MMNQIKHSLAFIWGSIYTLSLINIFTNTDKCHAPSCELSAIFVVFSSAFLVILIGIFLIENWEE
jgi:hypothetical protein